MRVRLSTGFKTCILWAAMVAYAYWIMVSVVGIAVGVWAWGALQRLIHIEKRLDYWYLFARPHQCRCGPKFLQVQADNSNFSEYMSWTRCRKCKAERGGHNREFWELAGAHPHVIDILQQIYDSGRA